MKNFLGAFADGAILFPIIAVLSLQNGFSGVTLLATAGLAYLATALIFRIPMSVQPLKAIAIAAVALGATSSEIRVSGALLGVACLLLSVRRVERLAKKIPAGLVHSVQLGIGLVLMRQGFKFGFQGVHPLWQMGVTFGVTAALLASTAFLEFPVLGLVATVGIFWAVVAGLHTAAATGTTPLLAMVGTSAGESLRLGIIASLIFPQLVLTFFNSVVATQNVAQRYYGQQASRVTISRLMRSIGIGNILSAAVAGLPYCHGSGGLTAHYRGGARHWVMGIYIGVTLLIFALVQQLGGHVSLQYPAPLLSGLLITVGIFHLGLAKPTWVTPAGKRQLVAAGLAAVITQNMLWVLAAALVLEIGNALAARNVEEFVS